MTRKGHSGSVFDEPHLHPPPAPPVQTGPPLDSVHQEPTHPDTRTQNPYPAWLEKQIADVRPATSWLFTLGLALAAGPLAVLTAFLTQTPGSQFLLLVVAAPLVEELGKIAAPLMTVERNPARFTSSLQPLLCASIGGLVFAVIENLLYLHVYISDPSPQLIQWRWTVCVLLHTGCSFVAGWGVTTVRRNAIAGLRPPRLTEGTPMLMAAVVIHGLYNFLAILIDPVFS